MSALLSLGAHAVAVAWLALAVAAPGGPGAPDAAITIDFVAEVAAAPPEPAAEAEPVPADAPPAPAVPDPDPPPPPAAEAPHERVVPPPPKPEPPPKPRRQAKPRVEPHIEPDQIRPPGPPVAAPVAAPSPVSPVVPAPAPPPPSAGPGLDRAGALRDFGALLWARIAKRKPTGLTFRGTSEVTFEISPEGSLVSVAVTRSSGVETLDQAAVSAVRASAPFPRPPAGASAGQLTFVIPFDFH